MRLVNGNQVQIVDTSALPPVVGCVRARITRPLTSEPVFRGRFGRAWTCDLEAIRCERLGASDAMLAHWIVEAPWSHQVVHSYSLILVHLRFILDRPVLRYLENATHEVHLRAIHPETDRAGMLRGPINLGYWIEPVVFAAQIVETSDAAAEARVRRAAELICEGRISPHPAHVRTWAELFGDNMLRVAAVPVQSEEEKIK